MSVYRYSTGTPLSAQAASTKALLAPVPAPTSTIRTGRPVARCMSGNAVRTWSAIIRW